MRLSCNFVNVYTLRARIPNIHAWNPNPDSSNRIFPNSFLRRCYKLGYMEKKHYADILTMFQEADDVSFCTILSNNITCPLHLFV